MLQFLVHFRLHFHSRSSRSRFVSSRLVSSVSLSAIPFHPTLTIARPRVPSFTPLLVYSSLAVFSLAIPINAYRGVRLSCTPSSCTNCTVHLVCMLTAYIQYTKCTVFVNVTLDFCIINIHRIMVHSNMFASIIYRYQSRNL